MKNSGQLSKKRRYQERFAVIYFVVALFFITVILEGDYNVFIVAAITLSIYVLARILIGVYVEKNERGS
ncbi:hypothetical protein CKW00_13095 [Salimicrobium humidisoli]|uniref:Uncharacterized protein n=1 Tax=Salimicrobium humidisoli TaxID=2029857 RepID=A0ABX4HNK6_9BACI|nr:hypothetical protein CKW00_13095 [Salimicrobium humidisoli]